MTGLRALILGKRHFALLLVALALGMKLLVPTGYMVSGSATSLTITICSAANGGMTTAQIALPSRGSPTSGKDAQGKADTQCPYSSLSMAALGGADAPLLALALAFILMLGILPARRLPPGRPPFLQPPLRGPPAAA